MDFTYAVLAKLDSEWPFTATSAEAVDRLAVWQANHPILAGLGDLGEVLLAIDAFPFDDSCELVWALLDLAVDDRLARRVLLQAIVPGLASEARWLMSWARRVDAGLARDGEVDQMLATAALMAIDHAAGTRRACPLKSILRRTHRLLVRQTRARQTCPEAPDAEVSEEAPARVCDPGVGRMLVEVLEQGRRSAVVSDADVRLLWLIGVEGYTTQELASESGSTARAVAQRRWRAETRLAGMVAS